MATSDRIRQQLEFIIEADKLKSVLRKTSPIKLTRKENSAEHSWQAILAALIFSEYSNTKIDKLKVVRMLAVHDVVEIDNGDVFHYHKHDLDSLSDTEDKAAQRIFGLLPDDQKTEYLDLWREFEAKITPESKFAAAIDRLMAFIMNSNNDGGTWVEYQLHLDQIIDKNLHIQDGSVEVWDLVNEIIDKAVQDGYINKYKLNA